jgi:hypothetical protein
LLSPPVVMLQLPKPHLQEQDALLVNEVGIWIGEAIRDAAHPMQLTV